ncbi:MAG: PAS domain S-box protein [Bryobacterales bacterium]|nr:PAS domain S-box protein [Bryobacterales bacterium]
MAKAARIAPRRPAPPDLPGGIADAIAAIAAGEVDALVLRTPAGEQIFSAVTEEHPYRALVEAMREGALTLTRDSMVVYANSAFASLVGLGLEKVIGSNFKRFVCRRDAPRIEALLREARTAPTRAEISLQAPSGRCVPAQISIQSLPGRTPEKFCAVVTDLTEVEVNHQSQARLASIVATSSDAIASVLLDGTVLSWNRGAEQLLGYPAGEIIGRPVLGIFPARAGGEFQAMLARTALGEAVASLETAATRKDGLEIDVLLTLSPVHDREGKVVAASAIARDFTERRRADRRLLGVLESAPDAIVVVDLAGLVVMVNSQAETLFGSRREHLVGKALTSLLSRDFSEQFAEWLRLGPVKVWPAGHREFTVFRAGGGSLPAEIAIGAVETGEGILLCATLRDVSERRLFQTALQERNLQLEEALLAKDRFLAAMSHELRTPLTAITGLTGLLLMRTAGPLQDAQVRHLERILGSSRHLKTLISDLLDLARLESGNATLQITQVGCDELVEEVMQELASQAEHKGLALVAGSCSGHVTVQTDRRYLRQILSNLVGNSVKYTTQGEVVVSFRKENDGRRDLVRFAVRDTGVGICAEDLTRLFSEFWRAQSATGSRSEGTGIGLYLSQRLASLLGGRITVESEPGRGSTFTLSLPLHAPDG